MTPFHFKDKSISYAFLTVLFWASSYPLTKIALLSFSPDALGFLRYLFVTVLLGAIAFVVKMPLPDKKDVPMLFLSGGICFFFYTFAFNRAQLTLSSATGSVLIATSPIMSAAMAYLLFREKINLRQVGCISVEFAGVLLLTLWDGIFSINTGIFWMLAAAFFLSGYNLIQRKYAQKYSAFQSTSYSIFFTTLSLSVFMPKAIPQLSHAQPSALAAIFIMGVSSSIIGYVLWSKALALAEKTTTVTNFMFLTPLLSAAMGFLLLHEVPSLSTVAGGIVILAGLILFQQAGKSNI